MPEPDSNKNILKFLINNYYSKIFTLPLTLDVSVNQFCYLLENDSKYKYFNDLKKPKAKSYYIIIYLWYFIKNKKKTNP